MTDQRGSNLQHHFKNCTSDGKLVSRGGQGESSQKPLKQLAGQQQMEGKGPQNLAFTKGKEATLAVKTAKSSTNERFPQMKRAKSTPFRRK